MIDASGQSRYPSALTEAAFNALIAIVLFALLRADRFKNQLFHIYLITYALFRIAHESIRDTPRLGAISTYQLLATALLVSAIARLVQRFRAAPPRSL